MTVSACLCAVAQRLGFGLLFAVSCSLACANSDPAVWGVTSSVVNIPNVSNLRYTALFDKLEEATDMRLVRHDGNALFLAQLSDQVKRQDVPASGSVAVLYPDIGEPYHSVFAKIIEGIEEKMKVSIRGYPIGANVDVNDLNAQLKRANIKVVVALGRQGLMAASRLDRDISVVVGGILSTPDTDNRALTGISLTPDPSLLFAHLRSLMPGVKRVIVVYDPQHNDWLIKLAREAAKAQGLELQAQEAHDLATAVRLYNTVFATADSQRDAVWLPQDTTTVDEATILPLVLKESWNRGIPIFSSSFLHVKKGALFALYPNNLEMGRNLGNIALAILAGDVRKRGVLPLRAVQTAINLRTASHFGLTISYQQQHSFDFVFPEP